MARSSSFGLKALWTAFAHFYPRNRLELPYTNTALFSRPQSKRGGIALEGYVPSAYFGGLTVDHLFSLSGLLPDLESSAELQGASPPGQMPVRHKPQITYYPRGRLLSPPPSHLSLKINLSAEENEIHNKAQII